MDKSSDKQVDKCTSVTNSLLPDSSSCSGSSGSWDKMGYRSYGSGMRSDPAGGDHDGLSSLSSGSSCHDGEEALDGGFEIELLSSEPEDYDESGHLFHMDIMKNSLSDISLQSTRRIGSGKAPKATQNLSFSRARVREIERHNQILLQRIMTSKPTLKTKPKSNAPPINTPVMNNSRITSAAVNRRKKQRQIEIDNQLLRKKLEKIERSRRTVW